ncbi:MAG: hypothetical protein A2934_04390 [Candidatus Sungbacteria bacterium RIFCSPLOWO2_01_FULL_47_10]|uniref:Uncharacterized protein n=1 Tax=Candidatus Sungbacteria bacterium RIFCSPLOWO2_01_FULL_47_10 TaxID=1802276 RepID=A0A1G2L0F4_9BACT|nr:MAG: hypothetical protein A2934_04390 [Candidatus Sungbacteria bacterium RIFCSPLOWO2_01_FULL_47_10]
MGWAEAPFVLVVGLLGGVLAFCIVLTGILAVFGTIPVLLVLFRQYKETGKIRFWNAVWEALF